MPAVPQASRYRRIDSRRCGSAAWANETPQRGGEIGGFINYDLILVSSALAERVRGALRAAGLRSLVLTGDRRATAGNQLVYDRADKVLEIDNTLTDLPIKKGLSSSAATCVLIARAFNRIYDLKMTVRGEMEFAYLGEVTTPSRCGRMDQGCAYGNRPVLMTFDGDRVAKFAEKPQVGEGWINGGFFVLDRKVLDYIDGDLTLWEHGPLERLTAEGQLMAYRHEGYWQPMDTLREKQLLESLWQSGRAPWKVWP